VGRLADAVCRLALPHPVRVGVTGRCAAGKSSLGDELETAVRERGRAVLRASIDDFHRPGHKFRSMREEWTPRTYYEEGYDYTAFRDVLLGPLGPGGSLRCRTGIFDSYHDEPIPEQWHRVPPDAVAIIDGAYILREELEAHWDWIIWLDVDNETMVERARQRDIAWVHDEDAVVRRYRERSIPSHEIYEDECRPREKAHAIVDNNRIAEPRLVSLAAR